MTELGWILVLLATAVLLLSASGFVYDHRRRRRAHLPSLLRADQQRAQATVIYYLHVHESVGPIPGAGRALARSGATRSSYTVMC